MLVQLSNNKRVVKLNLDLAVYVWLLLSRGEKLQFFPPHFPVSYIMHLYALVEVETEQTQP